ncbi:MAG: hypothetical protein ABEI77_08220 [Halorientalis sp.]
MSEDLATTLQGRRAVATIDGAECPGTIADVTYTPKNGDVVVAFELDEPAPSGQSSVALALDDIEPIGDQ